jgi:hypothetical protein
MSEYPEQVVQAQQAADAAWAAVETYRKAVDANRRKTAQPPGERHGMPILRPWTAEESAEYDRLHAAAVAAAEARAEALRGAGIASSYAVEAGIRAAVRGEA